MNKIYSIGKRKLTIWHADKNGQLMMTNTHRPIKGNDTPWEQVVNDILIDEGFITSPASEDPGYDAEDEYLRAHGR
jgi:hypothetical protein